MTWVKLRFLEQENSRRQIIAETYNNCITHPEVITPKIFKEMTQVWHQYVIRVPRRDDFMRYLKNNGIGCDIHYATPPHLQPCYPHIQTEPLPTAEQLADEVVSLPIAHPITIQHATHIAEVINNWGTH